MHQKLLFPNLPPKKIKFSLLSKALPCSSFFHGHFQLIFLKIQRILRIIGQKRKKFWNIGILEYWEMGHWNRGILE